MGCTFPRYACICWSSEKEKFYPLWLDFNHKSYAEKCGFYVEWNDFKMPFKCIDIRTGLVCEIISIPCGKCLSCRDDRARSWAVRATCESLLYDEQKSWFLTLTYDDANLPLSNLPTLCRDDITAFNKRLRSHFFDTFGEDGIRFFGCGEYGGKTYRPHYHEIVYNLDIRDLDFVGCNFRGDEYFTSKTIEDKWGKGFITLSRFSYDTAAYVARYVEKKRFGPAAEWYKEHEVLPEFTISPRRPGLGRDYIAAHFDSVYTACNNLLDGDVSDIRDKLILPGGRVATPPRYFDIVYKNVSDQNFINLALIKDVRAVQGQASLLSMLSRSNYSEEDLLSIKADTKKSAYKHLIRALEDTF